MEIRVCFVVVLLIVYKQCLDIVANSQYQGRFFQRYSSFKTFPLATLSPIDSLSSCVFKCLELFNCASFIYHTSSQTCYLGSWLLVNDTPTTIAGAEYFSTGATCEETPGFILLSNGTVATCVWLSMNVSNYTNAGLSCAAKGAHLYTFRSPEKFSILRDMATTANVKPWIGLDDIVQEGVYVWADDGSVLTSAWLNYTFAAGQPNNQMNQDCVFYEFSWKGLNDEQCAGERTYVCEIDFK